MTWDHSTLCYLGIWQGSLLNEIHSNDPIRKQQWFEVLWAGLCTRGTAFTSHWAGTSELVFAPYSFVDFGSGLSSVFAHLSESSFNKLYCWAVVPFSRWLLSGVWQVSFTPCDFEQPCSSPSAPPEQSSCLQPKAVVLVKMTALEAQHDHGYPYPSLLAPQWGVVFEECAACHHCVSLTPASCISACLGFILATNPYKAASVLLSVQLMTVPGRAEATTCSLQSFINWVFGARMGGKRPKWHQEESACSWGSLSACVGKQVMVFPPLPCSMLDCLIKAFIGAISDHLTLPQHYFMLDQSSMSMENAYILQICCLMAAYPQ